MSIKDVLKTIKDEDVQYVDVRFTDPRGNLIVGASLVWMTIGVLVMRNMINFDI